MRRRRSSLSIWNILLIKGCGSKDFNRGLEGIEGRIWRVGILVILGGGK